MTLIAIRFRIPVSTVGVDSVSYPEGCWVGVDSIRDDSVVHLNSSGQSLACQQAHEMWIAVMELKQEHLIQ